MRNEPATGPLANRAGPRLFVRGHFGFNADADRFWLSRLAEQYGMGRREIGLDQALQESRGDVRGAVLCDDQLPATEAVTLTLAAVEGKRTEPVANGG